MVTEEQVRESLNEVLVPGIMRSVVGLNLVRERLKLLWLRQR
jgi:metal-sulfur cluster biosynthetic enzyme